MKKKISTSWHLYIFLSSVIIVLISIIIYLLLKPATCPYTPPVKPEIITIETGQPSNIQQFLPILSEKRDRKVIDDPLYPPLNRTDRYTFESTVAQTNARNINVPTTDMGDTYRLVGYLTCKDQNKDAGGNNWKLMAREVNRNECDFYIIPTNKDYDVKVPLTPDVVTGTRLRDIYTIPKELTFNSPMLNQTSYDFIELPKTKFDPRYF